jgi:hypothetical protein
MPHAVFAQRLEGFENFADLQAELGELAATFLPFAAAAREELDTDAQQGLDTRPLGETNDALQLSEVFEDQNGGFP